MFKIFRENVLCPIVRSAVRNTSNQTHSICQSKQLLVVEFNNPVCSNSALVGSKGAQLAFLNQLNAKVRYLFNSSLSNKMCPKMSNLL